MALNTCEMWSNGIKIVFFPKNYEKSPSGWGLRPQIPIASRVTPVCDTFELQYTSLLKHVSQFRHFRILTIGLSLLLERVPACQHQATGSDLPFYNIFATTKNPLPKFLMTSLHVICGLIPPPNQKSWLRVWYHWISNLVQYDAIISD